jgi:ABC-type Fe3+ transport system permease subunit
VPGVFDIREDQAAGVVTGAVERWLWIVVHAVRDFAVPLFLATPRTLLLASLIWGRWEPGSMPLASAYLVVLIVIVVTSVFIGRGRLGAGEEQ